MGWLDVGKEMMSLKADELATKAGRSLKTLAFFSVALIFILQGLVGWLAERLVQPTYLVSLVVGIILAAAVLFNAKRSA